jgi:hypothetical protein
MKSRKCLRVLSLFCCLAGAAATQARENTHDTGFWITGGFGGSSNNGTGLYLSMDMSYKRHLFFALRTAGEKEIGSNYMDWGPSRPLESLRDYGILVGVRTPGDKFGFLAVAAGVSYVTGVMLGDHQPTYDENLGYAPYATTDISTVGIPVEAHAVLKLGGAAGIGFMVYANRNSRRSDIGYLLTLSLGQLE